MALVEVMREQVFRVTLAALVGFAAFFLSLSWLASYCTPEVCSQAAEDVSQYLSAIMAIPAVRLILDMF